MKLFISALMFVALSYVLAEETQESSPINCYVCNELEDKSCGDQFKPKDVHRQQCVNGEKYCRKIVQTVNDITSVVRQCAKEVSEQHPEDCYKTAGKATQTVCTCLGSNEPCNYGQKIKSSILGFAMSIILSIVLLN
ncbi:isoform A [Brachionus plicatilis]|uniref:Isoform A n=1 Tax=Brachionus plicatilis TaxID=10195 RepID=A0A3M7RG67_BRAPC|nr:isoform A [Brachionus plicatilis]